VFLRGALSPAPAQQTLLVPVAQVPTMMANGSSWNAWAAAGGPSRISWAAHARCASCRREVRMERTGAVGAGPISWERVIPRALFTVNTANYKSVVRFRRSSPFSSARSPCRCSRRRGLAALTLVSRDEAGGAVEIAAADDRRQGGEPRPGGMDRTFAAHSWDRGPTEAEGVTAEVQCAIAAPKAQVWALDGTGKRVTEVPCTVADGVLRFTASPQYRTIWYEIAIQ
jgi:hypothetical protein